MGAITRSIANNITTGGVFTSPAITNASVTGITTLANAEDGITFISSQTASNSASLSFTSELTSTYKAYKFVFSNIHSRSDDVAFQFNLSTDAGSNYNVTKTTMAFRAFHFENGSASALNTDIAKLSQSTAFQSISERNGSAADESTSGTLLLFNPASTTYVKQFISNVNEYNTADVSVNDFVTGYGNTTSAVNAIQFKMASGNMDGTIALYGIK